MRREGPEPDDFLPLPRDTFDVLVSLADRDRHGYAILQDIAERTNGRIRLSPSTLYAVIKRLLESELIEELSERPDPAHDDERRRYYRLTPLGREEAEELLTALLGTDPNLTVLRQLILEKTEGTPFFMEEVVQTLAEEGVLAGERGNYRLEQTPTALHISPTVQGVLAARIDRLAVDEKAL